MKLRFEKNSARYRMKKTEVAQLKLEGLVRETISFRNATFVYELRIHDITEITAAFLDNLLTISIPENVANDFVSTDQVGIYHSIRVNDNEILNIIIEKDFPCKDGPEEDRSDKFSELAEKEGKDEVC